MKDFMARFLLMFVGCMMGMGILAKTHVCAPTGWLSAVPEQKVIRTAAERNGIQYGSRDWYILLGINRAEGNVKGREFGIMNPEADNLDKQAGWCAASIVKSRARWVKAGKPEDFITFMGRRYCPVGAENDPDGLNVNWVGNVTYWANKLEITKEPK